MLLMMFNGKNWLLASIYICCSGFSTITTTTTTTTTFSNLILNEVPSPEESIQDQNEQLLQKIDAISNGKFCTIFSTNINNNQTTGSGGGIGSAIGGGVGGILNTSKQPQAIESLFHNDVQISLPMFDYRPLIDSERCRRVQVCTELLAEILSDYEPNTDRYSLLNHTIKNAPKVESNIYRISIAWIPDDRIRSEPNDSIRMMKFIRCSKGKPDEECDIHTSLETISTAQSWITSKFIPDLERRRRFLPEKNETTDWSGLFYDCHDQRWFVTYHVLILQRDLEESSKSSWFKVKGVVSVDIDVTETDLNQCSENSKINLDNYYFTEKRIVIHLPDTHKCHNETSECIFWPGHGMFRGGYQCRCKIGFHSTVTNLGPTFNGSLMEQSFQDKHDGKSPAYDYMFTCERCQPGCEKCTSPAPCLSSYNWAFRISLLTITVFCIIFVIILAINIYRYRKLKVIKMASPIFLCITLLGCIIMYMETIVIFPVMTTVTCVLTKWTRNFGFCLTYSSLLLKTWRVSLTYRVKSAHKLKLTDKQLLQWLFPILLVMAIYLGAWTISDTPRPFYITDWNNLKFLQCIYNWWDHSLTIGEFFFLLWGIKVCYSVRNAESLFDEAKYITWAIYNIAIVNIIMIVIHLFILPNSGPDIKYFFGFLRTQLSTTTTVILIFGPKFYRVIKGEGDLWHPRMQAARGLMITDTYAFNGIGFPAALQEESTVDLYQENDDLKRELQKMAAQLEIMKLCQMQFRNRHLGGQHHCRALSSSSRMAIQHQQQSLQSE